MLLPISELISAEIWHQLLQCCALQCTVPQCKHFPLNKSYCKISVQYFRRLRKQTTSSGNNKLKLQRRETSGGVKGTELVHRGKNHILYQRDLKLVLEE